MTDTTTKALWHFAREESQDRKVRAEKRNGVLDNFLSIFHFLLVSQFFPLT